ncbi:DUF6691 family protein [Aminobacter sp. HY435]|uniref:DUF6691 family protein n=1 Tax=Aminobacter sp. HY435 TaxID=2970917 RepID=UPI0022B97748|nr:DUF6691 family protein [Aminobacter sp. HY435]
MSFVVNLALGLLFGIGLVISGMSDPAKVLNFLDLFGTWDPSLAFVMGGAVITAFFGYRLVLRQPKPVAGTSFHLPASTPIDRRILLGSAIFGIGWGVGGFCPGPALTAVTLGSSGAYVFLPMMFLGMWLARLAVASRTAITAA